MPHPAQVAPPTAPILAAREYLLVATQNIAHGVQSVGVQLTHLFAPGIKLFGSENSSAEYSLLGSAVLRL